MSRFRALKRERTRSALITTCIVFAILFVALVIYSNNYYHADSQAVESFMQNIDVQELTLADGSIACVPESPVTGIIFYPGAKVEHTAYLPLMRALASEGVLAVVAKMPYNLAFLKQTAADGIKAEFPYIENWYMAGHSLGGRIAASYVAGHADEYDGLILLASYSTADLSETDLKVATVFGDLDGVTNRDNYDENKCNLPEGYQANVIKGGNHSGFGMYGLQDDDVEATISNTRQIKETADIIIDFIK